MLKRLSFNFLVFVLAFSLSLFVNSCAKKVVTEEKGVEKGEEVVKPEEKAFKKEEPKAFKPVEEEEGTTEAQLREETLKKQREREEAARREAQLREEFENVDIHFDFDKFYLTNDAREILADKASWLLDNPDVKIEIEGHCDEQGTNEYNMALGERRANSAMRYLINAGIKESRVSIISYGEEKPRALGHNESAWAKNRRAHFNIF